jgi:hypothetical protein
VTLDLQPPSPPQPDRGQRRYHVGDERLREFAKLTPCERLQWVEECATFVRLGQQALKDYAADWLKRTPEQLDQAVDDGALLEICKNEHTT